MNIFLAEFYEVKHRNFGFTMTINNVMVETGKLPNVELDPSEALRSAKFRCLL